MAFCRSFGAKLVELNTVAEYNYITSTGKHHVSMTIAPDLFQGQLGAFLEVWYRSAESISLAHGKKNFRFLYFVFVPWRLN